MAKVTPLSGFPEWLPAQRAAELAVLDTTRRVYEQHGFASLETRAVETVATISGKGTVEKEVYGLHRLAQEAGGEREGGPDKQLALHFDLTVPFARYVTENAGHLVFPFRRHQIQRVWRGERPQEGRFREFTQADVDIVGRETLALHHDTEVILVMADLFAQLRSLGLPPVTVHVSNRRLAEGFYRGVGLEDTAAVLRWVDKRDKIGPEAVGQGLIAEVGASQEQARLCLALAEVRAEDASFVDQVRALGVRDPLLDEGLEELAAVLEPAFAQMPGVVIADLRIARGLDYYTGTVCESLMAGLEKFGSVGGGGRYESLAKVGSVSYPGVGVSFGVTRALALLFGRGMTATRSTPSAVLVALLDEGDRSRAFALAQQLRARGVCVEVSHEAAKVGKQIRQADRKGIPYVWFLPASGEEGSVHQVKDIRSGEQVPADPTDWSPGEDAHPKLVHAQVD